jgi:hypothetical protein
MSPGSSLAVGDRVSFRLSDVFLPEPQEVLGVLTTELEANGTLLEFSDSGTSPRAYALVRITAHQSVLLPVAALRIVSYRPPAANGESVS